MTSKTKNMKSFMKQEATKKYENVFGLDLVKALSTYVAQFNPKSLRKFSFFK